jgi:hypothetical protein
MPFLAAVDAPPRPESRKFPVFSQLAGNFGISETSSQLTPPSSGESTANLTFGAHPIAHRRRRDRNRGWHVTSGRHHHPCSPARVTIIYRVLPSLIRPRAQGAPVFLMPESLLRGCGEGPESRLAEMDSGRKNRRRVYRVWDEQHGLGPAPSRRRVASPPAIDHGASSWRMPTWISLSDRF